MARGSIQRRGGRWDLAISAGIDPVTGQRRRITRRLPAGATKADAEKALSALLVEHDTETVAPTTATVAQVVGAWLELVADDLSPTTVRRYRSLVRLHIAPRWADVRIADVRVSDVDQWYRHKATELAPATVRQIHAVMRRALRQAVRWGWLAANPLTEATLPRGDPRAEIDPPSAADVQRVLVNVTSARWLTVFVVAAATSMRRSELCGLRWRDVDLATGEVRVRRAVVQVGNERVEKGPKSHQQRRLRIDAGTVALLKEHRARMEATAEAAQVRLVSDAWVFSLAFDGARPLSPDSVTQAWRRHANLVDVPARFHDLRHFGATELIAAGVDVVTVSKRLGHLHGATTLRIYAHAMESRDSEAADYIGSLLR